MFSGDTERDQWHEMGYEGVAEEKKNDIDLYLAI